MRSSSLLAFAIVALILLCGSQLLSFVNAQTVFIAISQDEIDDIDLEEVVSVDPFLPSFASRIDLSPSCNLVANSLTIAIQLFSDLFIRVPSHWQICSLSIFEDGHLECLHRKWLLFCSILR